MVLLLFATDFYGQSDNGIKYRLNIMHRRQASSSRNFVKLVDGSSVTYKSWKDFMRVRLFNVNVSRTTSSKNMQNAWIREVELVFYDESDQIIDQFKLVQRIARMENLIWSGYESDKGVKCMTTAKYALLNIKTMHDKTIYPATIKVNFEIEEEEDDDPLEESAQEAPFEKIKTKGMASAKMVNRTFKETKLDQICKKENIDQLDKDLMFMKSGQLPFNLFKQIKLKDGKNRSLADVFPIDKLQEFYTLARTNLKANLSK